MYNKHDTVCKVLKCKEISQNSVKYYGLDYPKVFNNFRCASITDNSQYLNYMHNYSSDKDIDNKMLTTLINRTNLRIVTCWEKNVEEIQKIENNWSNLFNFFCKKNINIDYEVFDSLIYHLFCGEEKLDMKQIIKKMDKIGIKKGQTQTITVYLLDPKYKESNKMLELLEYSSPPIHVSKNKFDTYQTGCLYFCENSLKHLGYQNLNNFLAPWMRKSRLMFLTIRNYIFNTITSDNYQHIMLFSSIILYILGLRPMNDLDMISYKEYSLYDTTNKKSINDLNMFPFIDCSAKGTDNWKHYWEKWLQKWSSKVGAKNFDEIVYDSKYHFYYFGVKIIDINVDIARRSIRNRPNAIADLLMINKTLKFNIKIPNIKKSFMKYKLIKDLTNREIQETKEDGYTIKNDELVKKCKTNTEYFMNRVIESLTYRYKDNTYESIDDLKKHIYPNFDKIKIKIKIK
jgi:hypothetical protein